MCLAYRHDRKFNRKVGWKVLTTSSREDGKYFTGINEAKRIEISADKFSKANTIPIDANKYWYIETVGTYPGGFHIFTRKADAIKVFKSMSPPHCYTLCKVVFKKQVAYGAIRWNTEKLNKVSTVVAQECKILEVVGA